LLALNEGFTPIKQVVVYVVGLHTDDWNGQALWSVLYHGPMDPEEYYEAKYGRFEFPPEEDDGLQRG
jgi:hypothetical protein